MGLIKKEKKEIIFSILKDYLKPKGYKWSLTGGAPIFYKKVDDGIIFHFFFNFLDNGIIECSRISLSHKYVENIYLEICFPMIGEWRRKQYKTEKEFSTTVHDSRNDMIPHSFDPLCFATREQVKAFGESVISYLDNYGFTFTEHFSYLPNILKEMDKLEEEGRYWNGGAQQNGILYGGSEAFFRGLIISKLCNDLNYQKKEDFVYELFHDEIDEWTPYAEKLIERLKNVDPIYNI